MLLEWCEREHSPQIVEALAHLLEAKQLLDLTLSAEGRHIKVHRVVLAAASNYFRDLLCIDMDQLPIIYLRDVQFSELQWLVQFIYSGRADVPGSQLESFLSLAKSLGVKGFTQDTQSCQEPAKPSSPIEKLESPAKRRLIHDTSIPLSPFKHTMSEPADMSRDESYFDPDDEDVTASMKKRRSLDESTSSFQACSSPRSAFKSRRKLALTPTGDNVPSTPKGSMLLFGSEFTNLSPKLSDNKENVPSQSSVENEDVFKKPFTPPAAFCNATKTNSRTVAATEAAAGTAAQPSPGAGEMSAVSASTTVSEQAKDTSTTSEADQDNTVGASSRASSTTSFDPNGMPRLDPNELAAKGATLLHHLALWMIEEKRLEQEEAERRSRLETSAETDGFNECATLPMPSTSSKAIPGSSKAHIRSKSVQEAAQAGPRYQKRGPSESDRPDSGFDSKDEGRDEPVVGTPSKEAGGAAGGAASGSSPELGEVNMSRQALIRQPVLRKRRLNMH